MTSKRLTKAMRDAFVRAVMADVPTTDHMQAATRLLTERWQAVAPKELKALCTTPQHSSIVGVECIATARGLRSCVPMIGCRAWLTDNVTKPLQPQLEELGRAELEQDARLSELQRKLRGAAGAATTIAGLRKLLPEFDAYIPKDDEAACKTLPAIAGLVADFTAAGFPKGGAK